MRSYILNPRHVGGRFCRTIVLPGREPRIVRFSGTESVELDRAEAAFLAREIQAGIIGAAGDKFPKPVKPQPPRRDPLDDPRDEHGDALPEVELTNTQRFYRDIARAQERRTSRSFE